MSIRQRFVMFFLILFFIYLLFIFILFSFICSFFDFFYFPSFVSFFLTPSFPTSFSFLFPYYFLFSPKCSIYFLSMLQLPFGDRGFIFFLFFFPILKSFFSFCQILKLLFYVFSFLLQFIPLHFTTFSFLNQFFLHVFLFHIYLILT